MTMLEALYERSPSPVLILPILLSIVYAFYRLSKQDAAVLRTLPWVGKDPKWRFAAQTRAMLAALDGTAELLHSGYNKYSKKGKSYIFPNFLQTPDIMVPPSNMKWLLEQPEDVLSVWAMHYEFLEGEYAFTDKRVVMNPWHERVIYKTLPRRIGDFIPEIWEEVAVAFDDIWGSSQDVKDVGVFETSMDMISRISNRMFVGQPLCRNEEYLKACQGFATQLMPSALFMTAIPRFLRPVFGPPISQIGKHYWRKASKFTIPVIEEHLQNTEKKDKDASFEWAEPNIYLSWHIRQAQSEGAITELNSDLISRRLMALNFAAIHTTTLTITNFLFDLFSSPPSSGYVEGIREEITRIYAEHNGVWSKAALARLIRTDSAIRESMRASTFVTRGLMHKVVAKDGLENKDEGYFIPKGTNVGMDVYSIMNDPEVYPQPKMYDAFRFSRPKEEYEKLAPEQKDPARELELKNTSLVTTGNGFFSFGHGRHACPGRFFVSHEIKLMIAYIVMNYDVELLPTRPKNSWMGQSVLPPFKDTLKIKRRARNVVV